MNEKELAKKWYLEGLKANRSPFCKCYIEEKDKGLYLSIFEGRWNVDRETSISRSCIELEGIYCKSRNHAVNEYMCSICHMFEPKKGEEEK